MVTVKIPVIIRELLREYSVDGESVEDTINRLLDDVSDNMNNSKYSNSNSININISHDTMDRIKSLKITDNESYGKILHRAIVVSKDLYNND